MGEGSSGITADEVRAMQVLAQRVTATRLDLVNSDASYGELAWNWGKGRATLNQSWRHRTWSRGGDLAAWGWITLPHRLGRSDGTTSDVATAYLALQVDPDHADLVDEVIAWYDTEADGFERTVILQAADVFGIERWEVHGYTVDPSSLGDTGDWTQLMTRDLVHIGAAKLPAGFRFTDAGQAGAEAAVQAHVDAWTPTTYTARSYEGVAGAPGYRADLHVLVEAPDGTMAASTIMWLDEANRTAEFEPVGTHPGFRRTGVGRALLHHGMRRAREAGAERMTVASLGAPGHPGAQGLYRSVGFRYFSRDVPVVKPLP